VKSQFSCCTEKHHFHCQYVIPEFQLALQNPAPQFLKIKLCNFKIAQKWDQAEGEVISMK